MDEPKATLEDAQVVVYYYGFGMTPERFLQSTSDWLVKNLADELRDRYGDQDSNYED